MKRVVLDTNVFISGFLFAGKPLQVLRLADEGAFVLLTSAPIREEVEEVLALKFSWPEDLIAVVCEPIWKTSENVVPTDAITACFDPDDNRILECAVRGNADYIVTGDHDLLNLKRFQRAKIVTPSAFLALL